MLKTALRNKRGVTLVEVMIVVAIIALLVAVAIPNLVRARETSQGNACISNLKQIECAISTWGVESHRTVGDLIVRTELFGADKYIRQEPKCPAGGGYTYNRVGDHPQVGCTQPGHVLP